MKDITIKEKQIVEPFQEILGKYANSGGKKCSFFRKFGVLCILETPVLRFALLPYYRRIGELSNSYDYFLRLLVFSDLLGRAFAVSFKFSELQPSQEINVNKMR